MGARRHSLRHGPARAGLSLAPLAILVALAAVTLPAPSTAQMDRERLDIRVFARVGNPGQPEPIAIGPDGNVYVGTNQLERGDAQAPSRIFVFSEEGKPVRDYEIKGQKLDANHGIQGLAFDADGLLYALDRAAAPRVILVDPATGEQTDYATFRDVPSCSAAGRTTDCSATVTDAEAGPDYPVFGPDGTLYVTDINQALIWRVARGGGKAEVWFTDERLESIFGPNGIQFMADGKTLLFAQTGSGPASGNPTTGRLYTLPVGADGGPGELKQLWESRPVDGPDGFALARSGNAYVALAGANQIAIVSPEGKELARAPATPVENSQMEVPLDGPASVAFLGDRVLVTNQSFPAGNPASWAVLDVFAGETGLPLFRPAIRPRGRIRLSVRPRTARLGRRTRFRFQATSAAAGRRRPIEGATIRFAGGRARTDATGRATIARTLRRLTSYRARASRRGFRAGTARVRVVR